MQPGAVSTALPSPRHVSGGSVRPSAAVSVTGTCEPATGSRASKALAIQARMNTTGSDATMAGTKVSPSCLPASPRLWRRIGHRSLKSPSKPCRSERVAATCDLTSSSAACREVKR